MEEGVDGNSVDRDDSLARAWQRLFANPFYRNGRRVYLRPLRGFQTAVYDQMVEHFKEMYDQPHLVDTVMNGGANPMESEPDAPDASMDNIDFVKRIDIGPDHVRLLYHRQEMIIQF